MLCQCCCYASSPFKFESVIEDVEEALSRILVLAKDGSIVLLDAHTGTDDDDLNV